MLKIASYMLGAGLIIGAAAASAGDLAPGAADPIMNSCQRDYHRLCSFVLPGHGRVARCLLDHEAQLAPNCRQALSIASSVEACSGDYERFCPGVPRGPQAFQCLADRMDLLMPQCRRVVSANAPYMPGSKSAMAIMAARRRIRHQRRIRGQRRMPALIATVIRVPHRMKSAIPAKARLEPALR